MGEAPPSARLDRENYLRWEAEQTEKHEYLAGEIFAMVGVRREHALVAGGIHARLRQHLKGTRCQAFVADMKLFVAPADAYFYPDVMVSCDERDRHADFAIEHPALWSSKSCPAPLPPTTVAPSSPRTASWKAWSNICWWTSTPAAWSSTAAKPTIG